MVCYHVIFCRCILKQRWGIPAFSRGNQHPGPTHSLFCVIATPDFLLGRLCAPSPLPPAMLTFQKAISHSIKMQMVHQYEVFTLEWRATHTIACYQPPLMSSGTPHFWHNLSMITKAPFFLFCNIVNSINDNRHLFTWVFWQKQ